MWTILTVFVLQLRKFLDEALQAIDNGTVAALDQGTLVSILTQYTQNLMEKHVTEEETAATTEGRKCAAILWKAVQVTPL